MTGQFEHVTLQSTHLPERRQQYEMRRLLFTGSLMAEYLERLAKMAGVEAGAPERRLAEAWRRQLTAYQDRAKQQRNNRIFQRVVDGPRAKEPQQ